MAESLAHKCGLECLRTVVQPIAYEIQIRYNNGDVIHGIFQQKDEALRFLQTFV
jgi:hypothetical protein